MNVNLDTLTKDDIKKYLQEKHTTLWLNWIIVDKKGLDKAAEWFLEELTSLAAFQKKETEMIHLLENNPCGPTGDEMYCACGCSGTDERCAYFLSVYGFSDEQVDPRHICCKIYERGEYNAAG